MNTKQKITVEQLKAFEPISVLSVERLEELQDLVDVEVLGVGVTIFREGDVDNQSVYLLDGDVQMTSVLDQSLETVISYKAEDAKHPLAEGQPRQVTCTAMTLAKVLRVDNSVLDYMMTWDQLAVAEEIEEEKKEPALDITVVIKDQNTGATGSTNTETSSHEEDGRNWIRRMRHIMAFKNMPPANIKTLLQRMETVSVEENEVIIEQGSPGDYYYVLTEGEAVVTRTVELATLGAGASFGEEALLSGAKRNASVTMATSGQMMRLAKADFNELLKEPLLDRVTPDEAQVRVAKGNTWLDVRHVTEFNHSHLPKAINIPLHELRMRIKELDKEKEYICYCGTGRRSSAAAFLLVQNGFKVVVLIGGVQKIPQLLVKN
ncbi:MAG: cyclic nucleotide-binding domain-containing protein [Gammaproteobacteria bacterium]|nr:cyclic nucleotide-binding domain-containing protein [Gammaproteobacteria bacterium]MDH5660555.1 cyclic nucleotide-binding domain-containing protein [Gammaproteobacteria bacterium]